MLPLDYPDDFEHANLLDEWFREVPWSVQSDVMSVEPRLRCIQNPATKVFVVVIRTQPGERVQGFHFFATAYVRGWLSMIETRPGLPVEIVHRHCEGMRKNAADHEARGGNNRLLQEAALRRQQAASKIAVVEGMRASTRETTQALKSFLASPASGMHQGMSPKKRAAKFEAAAAEFQKQREVDELRKSGAPMIQVARS